MNHSFDQLKEYFEAYQPYRHETSIDNTYAVIIPLLIKEEQPHVLFEVRSETLRYQPGGISFPGGKMEPEDSTPRQTAIRECAEELGIEAQTVRVLCSLETYHSSADSSIHPYVATIPDPSSIKPQKDEVDHVFTIPLQELLTMQPQHLTATYHLDAVTVDALSKDSSLLKAKHLDLLRNPFRRDILFYPYTNYMIWGITADILSRFLQLIKKDIYRI